MDKESFLKHLTFLMFFIFIADRVGNKFYWYYTIWWFDIPMHFLGGVWVGLFFLYVFYSRTQYVKQFLTALLFVLSIGILYELFEVYTHNYLGHDAFNMFDTASDIFFDMAGGTVAMLYYIKKIMPQQAFKVQSE